MINLPKPKLGDVSAITITSRNLATSFSYWRKLGFKEVIRLDLPFPWIQITDGALLINLHKDATPSIALTYYVKNIAAMVTDLETQGIAFVTRPNPGDLVKSYLMRSPDGMDVSLETFIDEVIQPTGQTILTTPPEDFPNSEKYVNQACGLFGELAHPVADIDTSALFWEKLGFKVLSKMTSPYPWAIMSDGLSIVGLHQTTNFSTPAITFFAADMKAKIEHLKKRGVNNFVQKDGQVNVVVKTPEDQNINLFKLGM